MNELITFQLTRQYDYVNELIDGNPESFLIKKHLSDKWSIHEHLAHLGRYQENFEDRINSILEHENPKFTRYEAEDDRLFTQWKTRPTDEIVKLTKNHRKLLCNTIMSLDKNQLERVGVHPKLGELNLVEWAEFFLLHETHHFYAIFWLVKEFRLAL